MPVLSVRLPEDLARKLPARDRSAWVIDAIRERLSHERIEAIARSAAEHADEEVETLNDWAAATAPLRRSRLPRRKKRR